MAKEDAGEKYGRLTFGGMARWDGLDLFGPNYTSVAYRRKGEIHVKVEPSALRNPTNPAVGALDPAVEEIHRGRAVRRRDATRHLAQRGRPDDPLRTPPRQGRRRRRLQGYPDDAAPRPPMSSDCS